MVTKNKCTTGWQCGGTCISRRKNCRSENSEVQKLVVDSFEKLIQRVIGSASASDKAEAVDEFLALSPEDRERELGELEESIKFNPLTDKLKNPTTEGFSDGFEEELRDILEDSGEHLKQLTGTISTDSDVIKSMGIDPENFVTAVEKFTEESYPSIRRIDANKFLDDNQASEAERDQLFEIREILNTYLDNAQPYQGGLWRGVKNKDYVEKLKELKVGDQFNQDAMSSFSSDREVAEEFGEGGILFHVREGGNSRGASLAAYSSVPEEVEVLVKRGNYQIANIVDEDGTRVIELEELS